jgi:hypothetical protein
MRASSFPAHLEEALKVSDTPSEGLQREGTSIGVSRESFEREIDGSLMAKLFYMSSNPRHR